MPQFQMLEANPSFGSQLGAALGGGVSKGISASLQHHLEQKAKKQEIEDLLSALNIPRAKPPNPANSQNGQTATDQGAGASPQQDAGIGTLTPEHVVAANIMNKNAGPAVTALYQTQQKEDREQRKFERQVGAQPFMEEMQSLRKSLPELTTSINAADDAIRSGDLSGFSKDYWAEKFDMPQLTSAKGKQLKAATKNFMSQGKELFGSRVTNYDVSLLEGMFARIGESKYAQSAALEIQRARRDLQQAKLKASDQVRETSGGIPSDIDLRVNKILQGEEEKIQENLRSRLEVFAALDGQNVDWRNTKKALPEDTYLVLKNGKPLGTANSEEIKKLKGSGYRFIK